MFARRRAWARLVVVALLAPAVLLASTGAANAATRFGTEAVPWSFGDIGIKGGLGFECDAASRWKVTDDAQTILTTGRCAVGWGTVNDWEFAGRFTGLRSNGTNTCTGSFEMPKTDIAVAWSFESQVIGTGPTADCNVNRACISAHAPVTGFWDGDYEEVCYPLGSLGQPLPQDAPELPGYCGVFSFSSGPRFLGVTGPHQSVENPGRNFWVERYRWPQIEWKAPTDPAAAQQGYAQVNFYVKRANGTIYVATPTQVPTWAGMDTFEGQRLDYANNAYPNYGVVPIRNSKGVSIYAPAWDPSWQLVGISLGYYTTATPHPFGDVYDPNVYSANYVTGSGGLTIPGKCRFYWGEKIADKANSTEDEPYGALPTSDAAPTPGTDVDPVVDAPAAPEGEAECAGFSLLDPSSWAGAAMCAVAGVLQGLWGTIKKVFTLLKDMPALLMELLGGLLTSLFVPAEDTITGHVSDISDTLAQTGAGDWQDMWLGSLEGSAAGGIAGRTVAGESVSARVMPEGPEVPSTASVATAPPTAFGFLVTGQGCKGPGVTWEKLGDMGLPTTLYPTAACEGTMMKAADLCKLMLTLIVSVGGAMKMMELIFLSLGAQRQVMVMTGADWSSAMQYR